jgi:hypothetical protein
MQGRGQLKRNLGFNRLLPVHGQRGEGEVNRAQIFQFKD